MTVSAETHLRSRFSEGNYGANAGLKKARDFLEPVKEKYPWISYADLWTLAGATAVEEMGGDLLLLQSHIPLIEHHIIPVVAFLPHQSMWLPCSMIFAGQDST